MVTTFTDNPVVANVNFIRAAHIEQLRLAVNNDIARRGGLIKVWTDPTLVTPPNPSPHIVREAHIRELRAAANYAKSVDCATDTSPVKTWTDDPLVANSTSIRAIHINELRTYINQLEGGCLCNCDGHCACNSQCCNCNHCGSHCSPH